MIRRVCSGSNVHVFHLHHCTFPGLCVIGTVRTEYQNSLGRLKFQQTAHGPICRGICIQDFHADLGKIEVGRKMERAVRVVSRFVRKIGEAAIHVEDAILSLPSFKDFGLPLHPSCLHRLRHFERCFFPTTIT